MTTRSVRMDGGSIETAPRPCRHGTPRFEHPWSGSPDTCGTVVVVGAGKMGLSLVAQYLSHGWRTIAVDIDDAVVEGVNAGRSHIGAEPMVAELVASAAASGQLRASTDGAAAAAVADVVIVIVPVVISDDGTPDRRSITAAIDGIARGLQAGTLVIVETTVPVGDTRGVVVPHLEAGSGLASDGGPEGLYVAFSPERLYSGAALANLATYPKLVGGIGSASTGRATAFYQSVLDAEVVTMSSAEAAELSKLAETTYRDVNIALANELARVADRAGVDITEVIAAANSQPYSHLHSPGMGVGGHCIPVYPHFLLSTDPDLALVSLSRAINDGQVGRAMAILEQALGGLAEASILVLGLTYRHGVKELAFSRGVALVEQLMQAGAHVHAYDPLMSREELQSLGTQPWAWGVPLPDVSAVITQTADPAFLELRMDWFPNVRLVLDGRNSLSPQDIDEGVQYRGIGVRRAQR